MYAQEPMRFLPGYRGILETDTYQGFDHFQEFPGHLEKLQEIVRIGDEYFNNIEATVEALSTGPAMYMGQRFIISRMMHDAIVLGEDPETAYDTHQPDLEQRLQEGKERFGG